MENPDLKKEKSFHPKSHNLAESFRYALAGISRTLMTQRNMKIHVLAALFILLLGLVFVFDSTSKAIMLLCITLVLFSEILNTAMEAIVDLYTGETHRLAQIAKDAAAGGVMLLSASSIFIFLEIIASNQFQIINSTLPFRVEKLGMVSAIVILEAFCLFGPRKAFWPLLAQGCALFFMVILAVAANEPIFSTAAFMLMALISFAPQIYKKDEAK